MRTARSSSSRPKTDTDGPGVGREPRRIANPGSPVARGPGEPKISGRDAATATARRRRHAWNHRRHRRFWPFPAGPETGHEGSGGPSRAAHRDHRPPGHSRLRRRSGRLPAGPAGDRAGPPGGPGGNRQGAGRTRRAPAGVGHRHRGARLPGRGARRREQGRRHDRARRARYRRLRHPDGVGGHKVAHHAACPVLIVPPEPKADGQRAPDSASPVQRAPDSASTRRSYPPGPSGTRRSSSPRSAAPGPRRAVPACPRASRAQTVRNDRSWSGMFTGARLSIPLRVSTRGGRQWRRSS